MCKAMRAAPSKAVPSTRLRDPRRSAPDIAPIRSTCGRGAAAACHNARMPEVPDTLPSAPPRDRLGRPLVNLRLSVTDRCNLRCAYCMPEEDYVWLPKPDVLSFEETVRLVQVFQGLGVRKVRLTGGEPLLRRDLDQLVTQLAALDGLDDLALTTNAIRLDEQAAVLKAAGLGRLTLSLDTLRPDRFRDLTRRDDLGRSAYSPVAMSRSTTTPSKGARTDARARS